MKSLLKKLQEDNGHDYLGTALVVRGSNLENKLVKIGETHNEVKAELNYNKDTFALYHDASDISDTILDTYQELIEEVRSSKWKVKKNSKARKLLNRTSEWFYEGTDSEDRTLIGGLFNFASFAVFGLTSLAVGTALPLIGVPVVAAAGYGIFHHRTKLKETTAKFKGDEIRYLKAVHALNAYAQIMEKEVADIEYDDEVIADYLVDKYGNGGIQEAIDKAQREVAQVRNATEKILTTAGIEPWEMPEDYVISSLRKTSVLDEILNPTYQAQCVDEKPTQEEVELN